MTASIADGTGGPWLLGSLSTQNDNCSGDLDTIQVERIEPLQRRQGA
jgi:hypothetical protein